MTSVSDYLSMKPENFKSAIENADPLVVMAWDKKTDELVKSARQAGRTWNIKRTSNRDYLIRYVKTLAFKDKLNKFMTKRSEVLNDFIKVIDNLTYMELTIMLSNGQKLKLLPFYELERHLKFTAYYNFYDFEKYFDSLKNPVDDLFKQHTKKDNEWFQLSSFRTPNGSKAVFRNSSVSAYIWNSDQANWRQLLIFGICSDKSYEFEIKRDSAFDYKFAAYHLNGDDVMQALQNEDD